MATKAQAFKTRQQLAAHAVKTKKTPKRKRAHEGRNVSRFGDEVMDRNANNKAGSRGGAALESSATGKPSRKSTRGSSDGTKRTTNLQLRAQRKVTAPSARTNARRH
jgi:hypothetical protein